MNEIPFELHLCVYLELVDCFRLKLVISGLVQELRSAWEHRCKLSTRFALFSLNGDENMIHVAVVYDSQSSSLKGALTAIRNLVKYTVAFAL